MIVSNSAWNLVNFRRPIIEALAGSGCRVIAVAPPDGCEDQLRSMGATFVPIAIKGGSISPMADLGFIANLFWKLTNFRPDALLTFTIKPNIYGGLAARVAGVPFYPTVSGIGSAMMKSGLIERIVHLLFGVAFRQARTVFFQNEDDRQLFLERQLVEDGQGLVVPGSGVDLDRFAPAPLPAAGPFTFLMIGRLLSDKGLAELADASRTLKQEGREFRVRVLGASGADNPTAVPKADIARWVGDGLFEHLSPVEDVRPVIADCHCVVLPSYREGLPRSLLEGAAMARPLIATDVPGCRELVAPGSNGLLCRERSAPALAAAMRTMLSTSEIERLAMGRVSREMVETRFDQRTVADAYRAVLAP